MKRVESDVLRIPVCRGVRWKIEVKDDMTRTLAITPWSYLGSNEKEETSSSIHLSSPSFLSRYPTDSPKAKTSQRSESRDHQGMSRLDQASPSCWSVARGRFTVVG